MLASFNDCFFQWLLLLMLASFNACFLKCLLLKMLASVWCCLLVNAALLSMLPSCWRFFFVDVSFLLALWHCIIWTVALHLLLTQSLNKLKRIALGLLHGGLLQLWVNAISLMNVVIISTKQQTYLISTCCYCITLIIKSQYFIQWLFHWNQWAKPLHWSQTAIVHWYCGILVTLNKFGKPKNEIMKFVHFFGTSRITLGGLLLRTTWYSSEHYV